MQVAILEVTRACTAACAFCYNPWRATPMEAETKRTLSAEQWCATIDKLKKWGVRTLAFSGGEPLLSPHLFETATYAKALGFTNALLTNGTLVGESAEAVAQSFNVVQISLHGTQKTHDSLAGRAGTFNRALEGRVALMEYDVPVSAVTVVTRQNLGDLRDAIALAAALDMKSVLVNRFLTGGRGLQNARRLSLHTSEVVEMLDVLEEASDEYGIAVFCGTPTPPCIDGLGEYRFLLKEGCLAGKGLHCAIDPSGDLKVCNHSPTVLGSCVDADPQSLYETSEYVRGFTALRYIPQMCEGCSKIERCRGGCREAAHALCGDIRAPDPLFVI